MPNAGKFVSISVLITIAAASSLSALAAAQSGLAMTPPMGWNDWAHYQCGFTAQTITDNARALVTSGLAATGYKYVTIDDCWMQKERDSKGNLQTDAQRFPNGMRPVADTVHKLGLKFGVYEDSGYETCAGRAGSGEVQGGGRNYFDQDARLFASWGVDYLKLDQCHFYIPQGMTEEAAFRKAYAEQAAALKKAGRPVIFSESVVAHFQGRPEWYSVLNWVGDYGELWRTGSDIATRRKSDPDRPRFQSVLWNYSYNLPLGRFQKPGNWNDADFIIAGDTGLTLAQSRSQMALWSMMSAPLILSSNISKLSPQALAILSNRRIIAIDQDALGRDATLVRRSPTMDVLFKTLAGGSYAVAVLNHSSSAMNVNLTPQELGFHGEASCRFHAQNLWDGSSQAAAESLEASVASDDTAIWRIRPSAACGTPARMGAITMANNTRQHYRPHWSPPSPVQYAACLTSSATLARCEGTSADLWEVSRSGRLQSGNRCLAVQAGKAVMEGCNQGADERWRYTRIGYLENDASHQCLSAVDVQGGDLKLQPCSGTPSNLIWSLPN